MKIVKQKIPALGSPDAEVNIHVLIYFTRFLFFLQEGPHSALKEDEFYDALDQSLDRIDREMDDFQRTVSIVYFYTFITHSKSTVSIKDKNKMYKIMYQKKKTRE